MNCSADRLPLGAVPCSCSVIGFSRYYLPKYKGLRAPQPNWQRPPLEVLFKKLKGQSPARQIPLLNYYPLERSPFLELSNPIGCSRAGNHCYTRAFTVMRATSGKVQALLYHPYGLPHAINQQLFYIFFSCEGVTLVTLLLSNIQQIDHIESCESRLE